MSEYALGCDVSQWQGAIDFVKMRAAGASFVFIKASQSAWADKNFDVHYRRAKDIGLIVGIYHYLDWSVGAESQARKFSQLVREYPTDIEPVVDYEERRLVPGPARAAAELRRFLAVVKEETGRTCMIYTSPGYWREFGNNSQEWTYYPLWVAHYGVSAPVVPQPWTTWAIWQFTSKGDGAKYGVSSKQVDLDYFCGTRDDLLRRYSVQEQVQEESTPQADGIRLVVVAQSLNVRISPDVTGRLSGVLSKGRGVLLRDIHVESASKVWIKHDLGWSALVYDGNVMMRRA